MENDRRIAKSKDQLWSFAKRLTVPFILVSIASFVLVGLSPYIGAASGATDKPSLLQMIIIGGGVIVLSFVFLSYAAKVIGLTASWLAISSLFVGVLGIMQFIVGPQAIYMKGEYDVSGFLSFNPNEHGAYWLIAGALAMMLCVALFMGYKAYHERAKLAARIAVIKQKKSILPFMIVAAAIVTVSVTTGFFYMPLFALGIVSSYSDVIFTQLGVLTPLALLSAAFIAGVLHVTFGGRAAVLAKKDAILAIVLWIGLALVFLYTALWIVYMTLLVTTWPLKTFTSSSK